MTVERSDIVAGEVMPPMSEAERLALLVQERRITKDQMIELLRQAGHPDFVPGGKHYRKPLLPIWMLLARIVAVVLVLLFAIDLVADERASDQIARFLCTHGLDCPADAPALRAR